MTYPHQWTDDHLDILKEIGNIGAGHAATSLSSLLNRKIDMDVPAVALLGFDQIMELAGGAEKEVVSICLRIEGEVPGSMFFVLHPEQTSEFVTRMTGIKEPVFSESPMAVSALQELGNIVTGSYLTALSDFTHLDIYPSVPSFSKDMLGAILSFGLLEISKETDQAIVIETALYDSIDREEETIEGHFFLFPDPASFGTLFQSLGVKP